MGGLRYKLTSPVLMWAIIIAGGFVAWQAIPKDKLFNTGKIGLVVLVLGLFTWLYLMYKSWNDHHKAPLSVVIVGGVRANHKLFTLIATQDSAIIASWPSNL